MEAKLENGTGSGDSIDSGHPRSWQMRFSQYQNWQRWHKMQRKSEKLGKRVFFGKTARAEGLRVTRIMADADVDSLLGDRSEKFLLPRNFCLSYKFSATTCRLDRCFKVARHLAYYLFKYVSYPTPECDVCQKLPRSAFNTLAREYNVYSTVYEKNNLVKKYALPGLTVSKLIFIHA